MGRKNGTAKFLYGLKWFLIIFGIKPEIFPCTVGFQEIVKSIMGNYAVVTYFFLILGQRYMEQKVVIIPNNAPKIKQAL